MIAKWKIMSYTKDITGKEIFMIQVTREAKVGRPIKVTEDIKDEMVTAYNGGASTASIAELFDVSVQTVRKVLRERRSMSDGNE